MSVQVEIDQQFVIGCVNQATKSVFSMMAGIEVAVGAAAEQEDPPPVDGVVSLISFTGSWVGTGMLYCADDFACKIGAAMTMEDVTEVTGDVLDSMGEMVNMILGNFKEAMESHTGALQLSVPTVLWGKNFQCRTGIRAPWLIIPFRVADGSFEVRVCMKKREEG